MANLFPLGSKVPHFYESLDAAPSLRESISLFKVSRPSGENGQLRMFDGYAMNGFIECGQMLRRISDPGIRDTFNIGELQISFTLTLDAMFSLIQ